MTGKPSKDKCKAAVVKGFECMQACDYTTVFDNCQLCEGIMDDAGWEEGVTCIGANMHLINWTKMWLVNSVFMYANLTYARLKDVVDMEGCRFHGAIVDNFETDNIGALERKDILFYLHKDHIPKPPKWQG